MSAGGLIFGTSTHLSPHLLRLLWEPDSSVKPEGDLAGRLAGSAVEGTVAVSKGTEPYC